jgi:hypothetical protein
VSFEAPPSLDPHNPLDVARTTRKLVQKLADQPDNQSTVCDLSERYFGSQFTDEIVRIAAEAVVVHTTSPVSCDGEELVLETPHSVRDYCDLICANGPDDPPNLLEIREANSEEVKTLEIEDSMNGE